MKIYCFIVAVSEKAASPWGAELAGGQGDSWMSFRRGGGRREMGERGRREGCLGAAPRPGRQSLEKKIHALHTLMI